jgi:hypothetical protein
LGERGGHREGDAGRGGGEQAARQRRAARPPGEYQPGHQYGRHSGQHPALPLGKLIVAGPGQRQRQQQRQPAHRRTGTEPLPAGGAPADRRRPDRQREDEGQYAQRLHHGERTVRQRGDVQCGAEAVQGHRSPPAGTPENRGEVTPTGRGRAGLRGESFL